MLARFWGTRGSLPVSIGAAEVQGKIAEALLLSAGRSFASREEAQHFAASLPFAVGSTFGGNSSCVEIEIEAPGKSSHDYLLCDFGSGAREFGNSVLSRHGPGTPNRFNVFMSHLHWDHIMGFPFFTPAYIPGNVIRIHGCHPELELAFRAQHAAPSFPVDFSALRATIEFVVLEPDRVYEIGGVRVHTKLQVHGGDSYGYRFEKGGKSIVYSTDSEHKLDRPEATDAFIDFFRAADLVIFDSMYSLADAVSVKEDWGHSSNMVGVELCQMAGARHLVLFHHEPVFHDQRIVAMEAETRRLEALTRGPGPQLQVTAAYDGLELPA